MLTALDFFVQKLNMDVTKKLVFFEEKDKQAVRRGNEVVRFNTDGTFTVERSNAYAIR